MDVKEMLNLAWVPSILRIGLMYVAYVLIGGVIFWKLEGGFGQKDLSELLQRKQTLLTTYSCLNQEGLEAVAQASAEPEDLLKSRETTKTCRKVFLEDWSSESLLYSTTTYHYDIIFSL